MDYEVRVHQLFTHPVIAQEPLPAAQDLEPQFRPFSLPSRYRPEAALSPVIPRLTLLEMRHARFSSLSLSACRNCCQQALREDELQDAVVGVVNLTIPIPQPLTEKVSRPRRVSDQIPACANLPVDQSLNQHEIDGIVYKLLHPASIVDDLDWGCIVFRV